MDQEIVPIEKYNINIFMENNKDISNEQISYIKYKYWYTNPIIHNKIIKFCMDKNFKNILEIGPGSIPFPLASVFIGFNEKINNYIDLDIDRNNLPFNNKELDFTYCRHVLEDIQNPDFALSEIKRVSKSFYVETPSPLVEITKGIDAHQESHKYCGYIHHRYIIWYDNDNHTVHMLPKYGLIENILSISEELKQFILNLLNNFPVYWNTYIFCEEKDMDSLNIKMYNHFDSNEYPKLLLKGIYTSVKSTNYFIENIQSSHKY